MSSRLPEIAWRQTPNSVALARPITTYCVRNFRHVASRRRRAGAPMAAETRIACAKSHRSSPTTRYAEVTVSTTQRRGASMVDNSMTGTFQINLPKDLLSEAKRATKTKRAMNSVSRVGAILGLSRAFPRCWSARTSTADRRSRPGCRGRCRVFGAVRDRLQFSDLKSNPADLRAASALPWAYGGGVHALGSSCLRKPALSIRRHRRTRDFPVLPRPGGYPRDGRFRDRFPLRRRRR